MNERELTDPRRPVCRRCGDTGKIRRTVGRTAQYDPCYACASRLAALDHVLVAARQACVEGHDEPLATRLRRLKAALDALDAVGRTRGEPQAT